MIENECQYTCSLYFTLFPPGWRFDWSQHLGIAASEARMTELDLRSVCARDGATP